MNKAELEEMNARLIQALALARDAIQEFSVVVARLMEDLEDEQRKGDKP